MSTLTYYVVGVCQEPILIPRMQGIRSEPEKSSFEISPDALNMTIIITRAPFYKPFIPKRVVLRINLRQHLTIDQLEDVVEDKVLAVGGITGKLESLSVVHGALLLIDL